MGLLFLCDKWNSPSELWLRRMIELLEGHISVIGVEGLTKATRHGPIPVVPFKAPRLQRRDRALARLGLGQLVKTKRNHALESLRKVVESDEVDRVLVHYLTLAVQSEPVWATTEKPLFIHCHGYDVSWDLRDHDPPHRPAYDSGYIEAVGRLSERAVLIANSHATAKRLRDIGVRNDRVVVKYLGVPVPRTCPDRPRRVGGLRVLFLGRLVDCKGPDRVIRAFDLACTRGFDGRLQIAGDGPMRGACEELRQGSAYRNRMELLGFVDSEEGQRLRRASDIFTAHNLRGPVTHQEEAYGVTIVEAMAEGLPVISGRSGSLPELIEDGQDGILIEPDDIEAHADALLRLGADPDLRRALGEAAWRKAGRLFSQEKEKQLLIRILGLSATAEADA